jgi:hypothetical protein
VPAKREDITDDAVRRLASYGCTQEEIADFFDTSRSVITARFGQAFKLGAAEVRTNVRKWQIRRARKGSDTMLIHLGKQYCGQAEKVESSSRVETTVIELPTKDYGEDQGAAGPAIEVPGGDG